MKQISYDNISIVLETWDEARFNSPIKDFDNEFGMITLKRLFELQPRAKKVFGYDKSQEAGDRSAEVHGKSFAGIFDSVFQSLGPDIELIEDLLKHVGTRHKVMNVNPSFMPFMGVALIQTIEQSLGRSMNNRQKEAWEEVFEAISDEIVKQILK
mmetsp:Transcript_19270/g.24856  ORF Transcript_19270/g.24856 Transcript_19270/m.24856 type:complete len:155 (+) Transcript_19270:117-581(+)|eukprot:CAMPEP_0198154032 /NCGR_PEP_ID=MMETSP1443-20131203/66951_1 /TAXON_ID=186043 /ORGANISM="Entomoneis sp., Strain CCMP2396" /LENGTH=154 /DNA_ID=CAMNT_0043820605 /DNA_START=40 /DNA_END=504 /DNA_ORIENTATION=+